MTSDESSQNSFTNPLAYLKRFVQSKSSPLSSIECIAKKNKQSIKHSSKNPNIDAKIIYENILGTKAFVEQKKTSIEKVNSLKKKKDFCTSIANSKQTFNLNKLMKAVESNSVSLVQELCQGNKTLCNVTDEFGWTPLMSACCAGASEVVTLFLQWGPDLTVKDKKGNTCLELAKSKGHFSIVQLLKDYTKNKTTTYSDKNKNTSTEKPIALVTFYCDSCKQNIEDVSHSKHDSSMIHLFNSASKSNMPTVYGIPESNKGFQILLKGGWDKEKGLGPEGSGHKFPPKTILKQDKSGLGAKKYKARVTHLLNLDDKVPKVNHVVRNSLKKEKRHEKQLERKLRQMLS